MRVIIQWYERERGKRGFYREREEEKQWKRERDNEITTKEGNYPWSPPPQSHMVLKMGCHASVLTYEP